MEPFDDDDEEDAGRGIDPEIAALEMASLEDFPRIAAHLRAGGRLTSELREFLADRVLLDSLSRYLREGSELTPLARGILADACESWRRFMRSKRGQKPKRSTHCEQLNMAVQVASLMWDEGIGETKACGRLAKEHGKDDPSMEDTFRAAFRDA